MSRQEYIAQWNRQLTNYVSLTPGIIVGRLRRQRDKRFVQFERFVVRPEPDVTMMRRRCDGDERETRAFDI